MSNPPKILWHPDRNFIDESNLSKFSSWLHSQKGISFENYDSMWQWSVDNTGDFWESIFKYFQVKSYSDYEYVYSDDPMPGTQWFKGATLNYAEHIFRNKTTEYPAIIFSAEGKKVRELSWAELEARVASLASYFKSIDIAKGDRIVAFIPNIPEATIGFLAACSIGAVWSSCSPDFGASSVVDRFKQIEPKVLITVDGYYYGGKEFVKENIVSEIISQLPSLKKVIQIPHLRSGSFVKEAANWTDVTTGGIGAMDFTPVPFDHPIWVLYSSGTTGQPKAITHSQGGVLLEHLKYIAFHNDVKPGERYFWFTTTGWMMWNFVQATMLVGATIVLYDGSPAFPKLTSLWKFADEQRITHFGTSAPFIVASMKAGIEPGKNFELKHLRSISSTGSPLPPEGFDWIYEKVNKKVWLCSMSGGTDVCSAFVGGCPTVPVYEGEIQRRALGCSMFSFDETGKPIVNEVGEMVITKPMPSMPIYFWNDKGKERYRESYFEMYPNIWRHGDWLEITDRNTLVIKGRSDATLNRHGVRIGTAEIYLSVQKIEEVKDSLVVNLEQAGGNHFMPLFVMMNEGQQLTKEIEKKISNQLRSDFSPRHVPDAYVQVEDIPYTISGKKMEAPVKKILQQASLDGTVSLGSMRNPESLEFFRRYAQTLVMDT